MEQPVSRGKTAAEKYAEIGGRENAPPCECHGELPLWTKDAQCVAGGYWRCRVRGSEWRRRPHSCGASGCGRPARRYASGRYDNHCADHVAAMKREYYLKNRGRIRENQARYYTDNHERIRGKAAIYRGINEEKIREYWRLSGYFKKRTRVLAAQRGQIVAQLAELEKEAETLGLPRQD